MTIYAYDPEQYIPSDEDTLDMINVLYADNSSAGYPVRTDDDVFMVSRDAYVAYLQMLIIDTHCCRKVNDVLKMFKDIGCHDKVLMQLLDFTENEYDRLVGGSLYRYQNRVWESCFGDKVLDLVKTDVYDIEALPSKMVIPSPIYTDRTLGLVHRSQTEECGDAVIETIQITKHRPMMRMFERISPDNRRTVGELLYYLIKSGVPVEGVIRQFGIHPTNHVRLTLGVYRGYKMCTDAVNAYFGTSFSNTDVVDHKPRLTTSATYDFSQFSINAAIEYVEMFKRKYPTELSTIELVNEISHRPSSVSVDNIGVVLGEPLFSKLYYAIRTTVVSNKLHRGEKAVNEISRMLGCRVYRAGI